jgi:hypothetical protein
MKSDQLSQRIGNIDDMLIEQAENAQNFRRGQHNRNLKRWTSAVAVLALSVTSFAVGAFAFAKEPEIVYVEKEQEIIKVGDSGISLILPDSWKGKYEYSYEPKLRFNAFTEVRHIATGGLLFWIERAPEILPLDYFDNFDPSRGFIIATTENHTYAFAKPWKDIETDTDDPAALAEYEELRNEIESIEIAMTADMLANSVNETNWKQGTAVISLAENGEPIKDVVCDNEQSKLIGEIVEARDYLDEGPPVYPSDEDWTEEFIEQRQQEIEAFLTGISMRIMVNGRTYGLSTNTGGIWKLKRIQNGNYRMAGEDLSAEELKTIMDLLSDLGI